MSDRANFGHDTTTDEVLEGIDLFHRDKHRAAWSPAAPPDWGVETARTLAAHGAAVRPDRPRYGAR